MMRFENQEATYVSRQLTYKHHPSIMLTDQIIESGTGKHKAYWITNLHASTLEATIPNDLKHQRRSRRG